MTGYTNGYFDLFHVGHLRLIQRASALCDFLIVGVIADQWGQTHKRKPVIPMEQRLEIVRSIKGVGFAVPVFEDDKLKEWQNYQYDRLIVGSDHRDEPLWKENERKLEGKAEIIYLPYTEDISTTKIRGSLCL